MSPSNNILIYTNDFYSTSLFGLLEFEGYNVIVSQDKGEVMNIVHTQKIDFVLLELNGSANCHFKLCESIRENAATRLLPVVFVTKFMNAELQWDVFECGADAVVDLPASATEIITMIETLLASKRLLKEMSTTNEHRELEYLYTI